MFMYNWLTETIVTCHISIQTLNAWFSKYIMNYYFVAHRTIGIFSSTCAISNKRIKILIVFLTFYKVNMRNYLAINTIGDNYILEVTYVA